jgi:hypothetical protein
VALYLATNGYKPGAGFSGKYSDLVGAPDLSKHLTQENVLQFLAVSGAVLMADGSVGLKGNLNFGGYQALNLAVHNGADAPAKPATGQLWFDTTGKQLKVYNGTQWALIGGGVAADVSCPECVDASDVAFTFAAANAKGGSAIGLACSGCVDATEVTFPWAKGVLPGGDAEYALAAKTAEDVSCAGCVQSADLDPNALTAKVTKFDDTKTKLGAADMQVAMEKVVGKIGSPTDFTEGNGTIVPYVEQWGLPAYGEATTYVHLMNPATPKVVMHMYAGDSAGFATSNNLVVAYDFAPNKYSGNVTGTKGQSVLQVGNPSNFTVGASILIHQTVGWGGGGTNAGKWELSQVLGVEGSTLLLAKPLENDYKSCSGDTCGRAQAVVAASYNQLEVVNGGVIRPSVTNPYDQSWQEGGVVFIRARKIVVKTGGKIHADGMSPYYWGNDWSGYKGRQAQSECSLTMNYTNPNNCSGGGGGYNSSSSWSTTGGGGGGGNKTAGTNGGGNGGTGGTAKGDAGIATLQFGGSGGCGYASYGGRGGGLVVIGAESVIVEAGGIISANASNPTCCCGSDSSYSGAGGGAGGTVVVFAEEYLNSGTVQANGSSGNQCGNAGRGGGNGGEGWVANKTPVSGSVNESYAKGVSILVDGQDVTAAVGDPNGKGAPSWDPIKKKWGGDGLTTWSTGPLDLTSVVPWTLGEHKIQLKEGGGAGGDIKMFLYIIYTFSKAVAPTNDTCSAPQILDLTAPVVVSGTTEDIMGKIKATDANQAPFCGGSGGPDVAYGFTLADWRQLTIKVTSAFTPRTYIKKSDCVTGQVVGCGQASWKSDSLPPGTYYLFVDADGNMQKGDFNLSITPAPPGPPANDTCAGVQALTFDANVAQASGMTLFANNDYQAACGGGQAPENVYKFDIAPGTSSVTISLTADFNPVLYVVKDSCAGSAIACVPANSYSMNWPTPGTYYVFVDGKAATDKGLYTLKVEAK